MHNFESFFYIFFGTGN